MFAHSEVRLAAPASSFGGQPHPPGGWPLFLAPAVRYSSSLSDSELSGSRLKTSHRFREQGQLFNRPTREKDRSPVLFVRCSNGLFTKRQYRMHLIRHGACVALCLIFLSEAGAAEEVAALRKEAGQSLSRAVRFFRQSVSTEGGYLWRYSHDLARARARAKPATRPSGCSRPAHPASARPA